MNPDEGAIIEVSFDVLDNPTILCLGFDPNDAAALRPDRSGQFITHAMRRGLFGATDERFRVDVAHSSEDVAMGPGDGCDSNGDPARRELVRHHLRDDLADMSGQVNLGADRLSCKSIKAGVLTRRRSMAVVARGVDTVTVIAESPRIAGQPCPVGGDGDVHPG